jgi:ketosteroid isomerase-like protein
MSNVEEVREASKKFYERLNRMANGETNTFADVWSQGESATAMHPIGGRDVGWKEVENSFNQVAGVASDGKVELKDQLIRDLGNVAFEVGIEKAQFKVAGMEVNAEIRVTNIYRKENGSWKMVHHHTDIAPSMVEALQKLQSK